GRNGEASQCAMLSVVVYNEGGSRRAWLGDREVQCLVVRVSGPPGATGANTSRRDFAAYRRGDDDSWRLAGRTCGVALSRGKSRHRARQSERRSWTDHLGYRDGRATFWSNDRPCPANGRA